MISRTQVALSPIAAQVPSQRDSVAEVISRAAGHEVDERMLRRVMKLADSPRLADGERLIDLVLDAGREALGGRSASMILYAHTLLEQPFGHRNEFVSAARERLELDGVPVYGISRIGCTSLLRAADLAHRYLTRSGAGDGDAVLVIGGDQGTLADTTRFIPPQTVCGDSAAAFVMRRGEGRYRYLGSAGLRDTRFYRNMRMADDEEHQFGASLTASVAAVVDSVLSDAGMTREQVDWIMPHGAGALLWRSICRQLHLGIDKVYLDLLPGQGHTFGTDAVLALRHADLSGRLLAGQRCLLVAIGQGAYYRATLVEVVAQ
jgi:3-oxoacyl-[acyl-carrier-protein] synthase-3